ncbi:MAG: BON domain-containing protein [Spirochaetales bacterium]|nr:BON domain-containing protein [Spirochaetales bacterium]
MTRDSQLRMNVEKSIFAYSTREKAHIDVHVDNGWVFLNGYVQSRQDRDVVIEKTNQVFGVSVVISKLAIVPSGDEMEARSALVIINNLARSNDIQIDRINVTVRDGTVELNGKVDSWAAKESAVRIARDSTMMKTIRENLIVMK